MDQEIPSQFVAQPCCSSICPLHFASLYISDPCLQQSDIDSCIGGWLRFLTLKVLWVQSHPSMWLALKISYYAIVYFFFLSLLGLPNSVALVDQIPEYNTLPYSCPTHPHP